MAKIVRMKPATLPGFNHTDFLQQVFSLPSPKHQIDSYAAHKLRDRLNDAAKDAFADAATPGEAVLVLDAPDWEQAKAIVRDFPYSATNKDILGMIAAFVDEAEDYNPPRPDKAAESERPAPAPAKRKH